MSEGFTTKREEDSLSQIRNTGISDFLVDRVLDGMYRFGRLDSLSPYKR